jgi:hypothetical protein
MFASAIGYGLSASTGTGALVALAVLLAAGLAALGVSVGLARMRGLVTSRATRSVLAGWGKAQDGASGCVWPRN